MRDKIYGHKHDDFIVIDRGRTARPGFALVECLVLIIVAGITLMALMSTVSESLRLHSQTRASIDAHLLAQSWFDTLEACKSADITASKFSNTAQGVTTKLGGTVTGNSHSIRGMKLVPEMTADTGFINVSLAIDASIAAPLHLSFSRKINAYSEETVPDNSGRR